MGHLFFKEIHDPILRSRSPTFSVLLLLVYIYRSCLALTPSYSFLYVVEFVQWSVQFGGGRWSLGLIIIHIDPICIYIRVLISNMDGRLHNPEFGLVAATWKHQCGYIFTLVVFDVLFKYVN